MKPACMSPCTRIESKNKDEKKRRAKKISNNKSNKKG
jgi:hypothetical protein